MNLPIITVLIPPLKVLIRGLFLVKLDMLECMLSDIANTQIGVLFNRAAARNKFSCK
jgi:hypothetical protein